MRSGDEYPSQNSLRFESADILSTHLVNCSAPPLNKPQLKTQNQTAQPGKSHAQLNTSADLPFVIDERYRSLICYNCGEPGHFVGNCSKPKTCFICSVPGHHMNVCPKWNMPHPLASYMGSAGLGLGFYHIDIPENNSTQWLNLQNCCVVRIKEGAISLTELERELSDIFCREWPWQIRELDSGRFLVRFPPTQESGRY